MSCKEARIVWMFEDGMDISLGLGEGKVMHASRSRIKMQEVVYILNDKVLEQVWIYIFRNSKKEERKALR